jgi:hypothetical protein
VWTSPGHTNAANGAGKPRGDEAPEARMRPFQGASSYFTRDDHRRIETLETEALTSAPFDD